MKKRATIGLVGVGRHGRQAVIPALQESPYVELAAVADVNPQNLQAIGIPSLRCYASLEQMLDQEELDIVYIATLASTHCELALKAFARGVHVICEKPLASSAADAARMIAAAEAASKELIVMFENRIRPEFIRLKEWIEGGLIGQVEAIHLQQFGKHPTEQPRRTNLLNEAGCLDCGIHVLDLARYWTNADKWSEIKALGAWFDEAVENPPHIGILSRLDTGVIVTFENSFRYGYTLDAFHNKFGKRNLTIVGSHGLITDATVGHSQVFQMINNEGSDMILHSALVHWQEIKLVIECFVSFLRTGVNAGGRLAFGLDGLRAQQIVDEVNSQCRNSRFPFGNRPELAEQAVVASATPVPAAASWA